MPKETPEQKTQRIKAKRDAEEAARDPGKDRSTHEKSRGAPVTRLTRHDPSTEEYDQALEEMSRGSDRASAVLGVSLVDHELRHLLKLFLQNDDLEAILFDDSGGPLSTLSNRTLMARALGLIPAKLAKHLDIVRGIRNDFAHAPMSIDFDHPSIAAKCAKLPQRARHPQSKLEAALAGLPFSHNRAAFEMACMSALIDIMKKAGEILEQRAQAYEISTLVNDAVSASFKGGDDNQEG